VRLLDRNSGEMLNKYRGHTNTTYKIASCLSYTDAHVLSGSEDGSIFIWDLVDVRLLLLHRLTLTSLFFFRHTLFLN